VRFHQWNVVTRRVEADKNVLLQVRDESSFHGLMLLVFRFEVIENVLEFLFQNLKNSIDNCFLVLHFVVNSSLWASVYKTFLLFKVRHVGTNRNRAGDMARDPNGFLTGVRQIALVKITFIVKRATIRVESTHMAVKMFGSPKLVAARALVPLNFFDLISISVHGSTCKVSIWFHVRNRMNRAKQRNQGCGSGSWKRKRWKRVFSFGSGSAKILPLPIPHRLFNLESNLAKKFCPFPNVDQAVKLHCKSE